MCFFNSLSIEISNRLIAYNIIPAAFTLPLFKQIRLQYNKLIYQIFTQYKRLPPQITYDVANKNEKFTRSRSVDASTSLSDFELNRLRNLVDVNKEFLFSRYTSEFTEIERLASGGFGSVYKVC